jgi:hypothetical protein
MGNNQKQDPKKESKNTDAWKKAKDSGRLPTEDDLGDDSSSGDSSDD